MTFNIATEQLQQFKKWQNNFEQYFNLSEKSKSNTLRALGVKRKILNEYFFRFTFHV